MGAIGGPKTGGRKPGTPNKETKELFDVCLKNGVEVFEAMVILAKQETDPFSKFAMLKEIAAYLYPKRKALEVQIKSEIEKQAEEFANLPKQKQIELLETEVKRLKGDA